MSKTPRPCDNQPSCPVPTLHVSDSCPPGPVDVLALFSSTRFFPSVQDARATTLRTGPRPCVYQLIHDPDLSSSARSCLNTAAVDGSARFSLGKHREVTRRSPQRRFNRHSSSKSSSAAAGACISSPPCLTHHRNQRMLSQKTSSRPATTDLNPKSRLRSLGAVRALRGHRLSLLCGVVLFSSRRASMPSQASPKFMQIKPVCPCLLLHHGPPKILGRRHL